MGCAIRLADNNKCCISYAVKQEYGCQPGEPPASLVTTNRTSNVYGFIEGIQQYDSSDTGHPDNVNIAAEHQEPAGVLS